MLVVLAVLGDIRIVVVLRGVIVIQKELVVKGRRQCTLLRVR